MSLFLTTLVRDTSVSQRRQCAIFLLKSHRRQFSVISLSDESAVKKFHAGNNKSILYFTASWCPPCKVISPVYEELSKKNKGTVAFGKVDVDVNNDSAAEFNISSVPTFIFFQGDKVVNSFSGADQNKLEKCIQDLTEKK
mmetsp:Transcript_14702/g.20996  ORF Transcript_14702/g.20996 Transcript_14702/m.20996 type:complete len:140 (+) Transcript_14702:105-524(+)